MTIDEITKAAESFKAKMFPDRDIAVGCISKMADDYIVVFYYMKDGRPYLHEGAVCCKVEENTGICAEFNYLTHWDDMENAKVIWQTDKEPWSVAEAAKF